MARTFADTIAADCQAAFLDLNGMGQSWTHTKPDGSTEVIVAILDEDAPQPGQSGPDGEAVIRSGTLACLPSIVVSVTKGRASKFTRAGHAETWIAVGTGEDDGLQEVRVTANSATHLRGGKHSGVQS